MSSSVPARPLRILHRSYAGDGEKPRPPCYSKLPALTSLLRAADALPVRPELVFLNDGPMPVERLRVMEAHWEVRSVRSVRRGGSDARSYREMLSDEAARPGDGEELVWLAEDDYLHVGDAFVRLLAAAERLPQADCLMLYGSVALDVARSAGWNHVRLPQGGPDGRGAEVVDVDGARWFRLASTTSTFGLRRRALREDVRLLRFGALTGGAWDDASCLLVQGFRPFGPGEVRRDLLPFGQPVAVRPRSVARGVVRSAALSVSALSVSRREPGRRRVFVGSDPELAFHMEAMEVAPHPASVRTSKIDWSVVAAESAEWGCAHGIAGL
jgi:hypothetical protein